MGLETGTYIDSLVVTNPLGSDAKSAGDDHIRLLKATIKATFPNITGAVTPTQVELNHVAGVTSAIQTQLNGKAAAGSYQTADATLTGLAALVIAVNEIPVGSGADTFSKLTLDIDGTLAANSDVKLATQKAVKTYADTKLNTANFTGTNQSLAANGYQKLPGGLILQWGTVAVAARGSWETDFGLITLPVAFPTAALNASATVLSTDAASAIEGYGGIKSVSLTQINPIVGSTITAAGNYGVYWQAIGY